MEKTIIRQIWMGQRGQFDLYKMSEEAEKVFGVFVEKANGFQQKLTKELVDEFNEVIDAHVKSFCVEEIEQFEEGFKLGLRIGIEAYQTPETK